LDCNLSEHLQLQGETMKSTVHILSGIPGCGKSTWAQRQDGAVICSADSFFVARDTIDYDFDPTKIGEAHAECFGKFLDALNNRMPTIIVDNTNIHPWEQMNYEAVARHGGGNIVRHRWIVETFADVDMCLRRQIHGVPREIVLRMAHDLSQRVMERSTVEHSISVGGYAANPPS
ncbi:MAG: AAA family ATPase, partial [Planctomycetota bacterium]